MRSDRYRRIGHRELYRNPWVAVEAHEIVHPTGARGEHVLIVTPQACGVVVADDRDLLFARQPRFAAERLATEIVKGGQHAGESLLESAQRELREELGITAHRWVELGYLREIPSLVATPVVIFLARDVEFAAPQPDGQESIALIRLSIGAAIEAALAGEIDDAVTVAAIFRFAVLNGNVVRAY
jgi:8-oxo-dGDP phosphatase